MAVSKIKFIKVLKNGSFVVDEGTLLDEKLIAHKDDGEWKISDSETGSLIEKGFPTLKACKEWFMNMDEELKEKLSSVRQSESYLKLKDKVKEQAKILLN